MNFSDDIPNVNANVVVEDNDFVRLTDGYYPTYRTYGLLVDSGCSCDLGTPLISNCRFVDNRVTNLTGGRMYGVVIKGNYFEASGNTFTHCDTPIIVYEGTVGNITSPNTIIP